MDAFRIVRPTFVTHTNMDRATHSDIGFCMDRATQLVVGMMIGNLCVNMRCFFAIWLVLLGLAAPKLSEPKLLSKTGSRDPCSEAETGSDDPDRAIHGAPWVVFLSWALTWGVYLIT